MDLKNEKTEVRLGVPSQRLTVWGGPCATGCEGGNGERDCDAMWLRDTAVDGTVAAVERHTGGGLREGPGSKLQVRLPPCDSLSK